MVVVRQSEGGGDRHDVLDERQRLNENEAISEFISLQPQCPMKRAGSLALLQENKS